MLREAVRRRIQDLGGERVGGPRGPRTGEHGQSDPLADHRHVPFAEDRPGRLFETREIRRVTGIHPQAGLTTGDADEAAMKRTLASRAAETYVRGSAEKIGTASRYEVLPLDAVTAVITDVAPEDAIVGDLERAGAALRRAG
ncbi:hypothetical protein [Microbacterium lacticum]|uniref:hypothetical protein n=1 Tax=Microbacterium lacticum TaxID=33885 RepID=UPI0028D59398|nr:hypothetical protein [Microbacterium lacticum]